MNRITIVTVCDNHFVIMLAALIKSIEVNHHTGEIIEIFIIKDNVKAPNIEKLEASISSEQIKLHWKDISEVLPADIKLPRDKSSFPLNIYIRLFIADFIDQNLEKVIYLDVDMIFKKDISFLWNKHIGNNIVAAVADKTQIISNEWAGVKNYKELNLNPHTKYFNSGLMIINPIKWRNSNISQKVIQCIRENIKFAHYPDQYGLNVVLADKWFELDDKWNCQSVSENIDPYVIHFTGRKPIYKSYDQSLDFNAVYKNEFYQYINLTEWRDYNRISEYKRLLKKLYIRFEKRIWRMK